ncbi:MAG TPA: hypothetical protein VGA89_01565 [Patescibacteria group bacterium]|jgi:Tfp pilus assembly protein PilO
MAGLNPLSNFNWQLLVNTRKDLVMAVAFGIVAGLLAILTYTQVTNAVDVNRNLQTENNRINQLNQKAKELEQIKFSPEFTQAEQINRVLPSHKPLLELLNNLNNVAGETKVTITEFEINPGEIATDSTQPETAASQKRANADYNQLDLDLTIVGPLAQIRRFMELIERVTPLTTITSLTVDRKVSNILAPDATRADLSLSTYYYTKPITSTLSSALPEISAAERAVFQDILLFTPSEIEQQTTIVGGSNNDLFGIQGLTVTDLEETLGVEKN